MYAKETLIKCLLALCGAKRYRFFAGEGARATLNQSFPKKSL